MISINGTRFHTYQRISRLLHINGDKLSVLQLICTLLPCWLGCWCWSSCFIHRKRMKKKRIQHELNFFSRWLYLSMIMQLTTETFHFRARSVRKKRRTRSFYAFTFCCLTSSVWLKFRHRFSTDDNCDVYSS